jgi:hypothetical protein
VLARRPGVSADQAIEDLLALHPDGDIDVHCFTTQCMASELWSGRFGGLGMIAIRIFPFAEFDQDPGAVPGAGSPKSFEICGRLHPREQARLEEAIRVYPGLVDVFSAGQRRQAGTPASQPPFVMASRAGLARYSTCG